MEQFKQDFFETWNNFSGKRIFFGLLTAWLLLFHFFGNVTFGYVKTASLFEWMHHVFSVSVDDEHGFFIPLVVLGIFWWKRKDLIAAKGNIWWPALGLFIFAVGLHLLGFLVQQTRISIVALFFGVYALFGLVWGKEFMKRSFFPMFLFIFCVPLGAESERITFPLRLFATSITSAVADGIFGIQVIRDGTRLFDAAGKYQYEVAAACSGIRSLTAILIFTTIYSFVAIKSGWKRVGLIALTLPLAVVSNVIRLMMIIFAAEFFGETAGTYVHDSGWLSMLPYVPSLLIVVFFGNWLRTSSESKNNSTT